MMLRVVLLILSTSLVPVLGTGVCLCTESDVLIRTMPSPTAPVTGKLAMGSCLKPSQFKRSGEWLQFTGDGTPSGYLLDVLQPKPCTGGMSKRQSCHSWCQSTCCGGNHHHLTCSSCGDHCCNSNGPEWSSWSHCSGTCGEGTHTRTCTDHCSSLDHHTQTETCHHTLSCPVWSAYGSCSVTCGDGTQSRHCTHHCFGLHQQEQSQACHKPACGTVVTPVSDHTCNKESVVQALAFQIPENCTTLGHHSYTQFVIQHCRAPVSIGNWVKGTKTHTHCDTVPMYSPVATFHHNSYDQVIAGVLVGCETNGEFKVITSTCGHPPQVMHVSSNNGIFHHVYQVKW